ncbi:kinase-like domain-containing protein [Scenedesmus sp. NREL 46B-D3]|nr:kinase-like domain-containing protein [Scenedesmus sp. NREL 46B-D3]
MTCQQQHQQQELQGLAGTYQLGTTLGQGAFGKVSLAVSSVEPCLGWQPTGPSAVSGREVVVKQVRTALLWSCPLLDKIWLSCFVMIISLQVCISGLSQQEQLEAINEVKVMQGLDHLNIVRYIECIQQDSILHIVMEYCRYGDLGGLIANRARTAKPFSEPEIMFWFVQIALALWQLHSKGILHRDLKSQNIFIADGAIAKLGDFGISRVLNSETELVKTAIGTPYYLSPEICQDKPYNRKSDCWALGCVLYELASLRRAFDGGSLPALVVKILRGRYPALPIRYSLQLRGLVDALLQQDPQTPSCACPT